MSRRSLVSGAGGFIGSRLALRLRETGEHVCGIGLQPLGVSRGAVHKADITRSLAPELFAGIDTVFHLAGKVHALSEIQHDDDDYFRINTQGTLHMLEAACAARVRRFVFFSTVKAMSRDEVKRRGDGARQSKTEAATNGAERAAVSGRPLDETDLIEPDTPYGRSKLEAEKLVLKGGYVPEPVVLRLCMVYGAGAKGNVTKMLRAISERRFPPMPDVGNRRSMVHVQDVVKAAILVSQRPEAVGQVFIVSDGLAYSTHKIFQMMCRALNKRVPSWSIPLPLLRGLGVVGDFVGRVRGRRFVFDSDALAKLVGSAWFSSEKLETMLGFKPEWNLEKALPEMVAEMRGHAS